MRNIIALVPLLALASCMMMKPDYAAMTCTSLEAKRVKLVGELNAIPAAQTGKIKAKTAEIDAIGVAQVDKGCAG